MLLFPSPPSLPSFLPPFLPLLLAGDTNLIKKLTVLEELSVEKTNCKLRECHCKVINAVILRLSLQGDKCRNKRRHTIRESPGSTSCQPHGRSDTLLGSDARKMGVKVSSGLAMPSIVAFPEAGAGLSIPGLSWELAGPVGDAAGSRDPWADSHVARPSLRGPGRPELNVPPPPA